MPDLPVDETHTGYSEVLTANQKDQLDREKRIERLLILLSNRQDEMKEDIKSIKAHLSIVTGEESL